MYIPSHSKQISASEVIQLIQDYSFATLISLDESQNLSISHIPVLVEAEGDQIKKIITHISMANPQAKHLMKNPQATFVFQGAHAYISPRWYRSGRDVPTWNYEAVHVIGKVNLVVNPDGLIDILKRTSAHFEGPEGWQFELPADLVDPKILSKAIIGIELIPEKIEAKSKLSLNRVKEDIEGVIEGLARERKDENSLAIKNKMSQRLSSK